VPSVIYKPSWHWTNYLIIVQDSLGYCMYNQPKESSNKSMATDRFVQGAKAPRKRAAPKKKRAPAKRTRQLTRVMRDAGGVKAVIRSPQCTSMYLHSLMDPFSAPSGACLPSDMFPLPSQKLKVFLRGSCVLGTTGFGFISVIPTAANDAVGSGVSAGAWATTSTSVMANNTALNAVTNTQDFVYAENPFSNANLVTTNVAQVRLVALGVRLRYTGTEAGRNGIINTFESPDHTSVAGMSYLFIRSHPSTRTYRPQGDGDWTTAVYSGPVVASELTFLGRNPIVGSGTLTTGNGVIAVTIQGVAADTYEFECFEHYEAIGVQSSGKTQSDADMNSFAKAQEAVKDVAGQQTLSVKEAPKVFGEYVQKLVGALPFVIETGSNIARALGGNPVSLLQQITGVGMQYIKGPQARQPLRLGL